MSTTTYVQTSFRISEETQTAIRDLAGEKNISQSELIRAAIGLYSATEKSSDTIKLAMVDVSKSMDGKWFKVDKWIVE